MRTLLCLSMILLTACGSPVKSNANANTNSPSPTPVNQAPIAENDDFNIKQNTNMHQIDVLNNDQDPDGDSLSITSAHAQHGTASISNNLIQYSPANNFVGTDLIQYTISDSNGKTDTATLSVHVTLAHTVNNEIGRIVRNNNGVYGIGIPSSTLDTNNFNNWSVESEINANVVISGDGKSVSFTRTNPGNARAYISFTTRTPIWTDQDVSLSFSVDTFSTLNSGTQSSCFKIENNDLSGTKSRTPTGTGTWATVLTVNNNTNTSTIYLGIGVDGNDSKIEQLSISKISISPTSDGLPNMFVENSSQRSGFVFHHNKQVTYNANTGSVQFTAPSSIDESPALASVIILTDSFGSYVGRNDTYNANIHKGLFFGSDDILTPAYVINNNSAAGRSLHDTNPNNNNTLDNFLTENKNARSDDAAPGIAIIAQGVNDFVVEAHDAATTFTNLQAHVNWCNDNNLEVIIVTAGPFQGYSKASAGASESERNSYNALVRNYATSNKLTLVDYDLILDSDRDGILDSALTNDSLHPNGDGMHLLQNAFDEAINNILMNAKSGNN